MGAKFKLNDRYIAFAIAVATGSEQLKAYIEHVATRKNVKKSTAATNSSNLMKRPEIRDIVEETRKAHSKAIIEQSARLVAAEFKTTVLTIDELDSFHSAIVQGLIEVEEVIPVYTNTYDTEGVLKLRQTSFMRVKRPPNAREKQISADALFKRFGAYAPNRFLGAFGKVKDDGEVEDVQRMLILSTGERIPMEP